MIPKFKGYTLQTNFTNKLPRLDSENYLDEYLSTSVAGQADSNQLSA